jgi:Zn finger protein HypA/HybF involved in hydrogenase expression
MEVNDLNKDSSCYEDYQCYTDFLKANGIINAQGETSYRSYGLFYECLDCKRTRISKIELFFCPFCNSKNLKNWNTKYKKLKG